MNFKRPLSVCLGPLFSVLFSVSLLAQSEPLVWYFGNNAGIDFRSGSSVAISNNPMISHEATAVASDNNGDILFFTNGVYVWNANHQVMPNGTGLLVGTPAIPGTSTQGALIVKKPGSNTLYYIFTTEAQNQNPYPKAMRYSIVDMSLQGGMGDVTVKNALLIPSSTEKLTAVKHANGTDIWVIGHEKDSDAFYSFLVSSAGILPPVVSTTGVTHVGIAVSYMRANKTGDKLAVSTNWQNMEVFDFDKNTGIVSNPISLLNPNNSYGVCFSPNGELLYVSENAFSGNPGTGIYQYDLTAGTTAAINGSRIMVGNGAGPGDYGAIEIGPDGKMYVARYGELYLGVIHNPDIVGLGCNYVDTGFNLIAQNGAIGLSQRGLPNFMYNLSFTSNGSCTTDSVDFQIPSALLYDSLFWDFGDTASGTQNYSQDFSPSHHYSTAGSYTVTLTVYHNGISKTATNIIQVTALPIVDIGQVDTTLCWNMTLTLTPTISYSNVEWQDGSGDAMYTVRCPGIYWVEVINVCGSQRDSVTINFQPEPVIDLGNDTALCIGDTVILSPTFSGGAISWQDGSTDSLFPVTSIGSYWAEVTDFCGSIHDSVTIDSLPFPSLSIGEDTTICWNSSILLNVTTNAASIQWLDSSSASTLTVEAPGTYWATAYNSCGAATDSVSIDFYPMPTISLGADTGFCPNSSILLMPTASDSSIFWQDSSMSMVFEATTPGIFWAEVSDQCGSIRDSVTVDIYPGISVDLGNDTIICEQKTITLNAGNPGASYLWNDGSSDSLLEVSVSSVYHVTATNSDGCTATDTIDVTISQTPNVSLGPDTTIIDGQILVLNAGFPDANYEWSTGDTTQTIFVDSPSVYSVIVYDENGCSSADTIEVNVVSAIGEMDLSGLISVFPNPVGDMVFVEGVSPDSEPVSLQLVDALGRIVISQGDSLKQKIELEVAPLPPGTYWLRMAFGDTILVKKLVKL